MKVAKAVRERRTIRKFKKNSIPRELLRELVEGARLAPSAANLQPLKYLVVNKSTLVRKIFPVLHWAAYITPEGDPPPGHRPTAYIIILVDRRVREKNYQWEVGAAVQNILLGAWEMGVGSCWLLSVDRPRLKRILNIPAGFLIDSVIALGYPDERPRAVEMKKDNKYWKNGKGVLHVPKRSLGDVLFWNAF